MRYSREGVLEESESSSVPDTAFLIEPTLAFLTTVFLDEPEDFLLFNEFSILLSVTSLPVRRSTKVRRSLDQQCLHIRNGQPIMCKAIITYRIEADKSL